MNVIRARWQWLGFVVCLAALAPLLMAPEPKGCPACSTTLASWDGALDPQEAAPHWYQVQNGLTYLAYLGIEGGSASLGISGQVVSQLQCGPVQGGSLCSFTASGTGVVTMTVTGGSQGADYYLAIGYP